MRRWTHRVAARVGEDLVDAVFPEACRSCGRELPERGTGGEANRARSPRLELRRHVAAGWSLPLRLLCRRCTTSIDPLPTVAPMSGLDRVPCIAAFAASPVLFALVHALKYEGLRELAPWFGSELATAVTHALSPVPRDAVLVPMPLHASRLCERGFNQSLLLAWAVESHLGIPVVDSVLRRSRATRPQAQLPHAVRAENVRGCFERIPDAIALRTWILVDDVVTTGATVCAALEALGAPRERVAVLVLCRARDTAP